MEPIHFTRLSHDKWERAVSGSIAYSAKGIDIRTVDGPTLDHFRVLLSDQTVVANLVALNHTYIVIGGSYVVDRAEDGRIFLRPHRT